MTGFTFSVRRSKLIGSDRYNRKLPRSFFDNLRHTQSIDFDVLASSF